MREIMKKTQVKTIDESIKIRTDNKYEKIRKLFREYIEKTSEKKTLDFLR